MAFVATFLVRSHTVHVDPKYVWLVYSALATVSAALIGASAPSSAEFHREASLVTGAEVRLTSTCSLASHFLVSL